MHGTAEGFFSRIPSHRPRAVPRQLRHLCLCKSAPCLGGGALLGECGPGQDQEVAEVFQGSSEQPGLQCSEG